MTTPRLDIPPRRAYRIRVTLLGTDPEVWRLLAVRGGETLERVHGILQYAMGWRDHHLYRFEADGRRYEEHDPHGRTRRDPSAARVRLCDVAPETGDSFHYEYDFGDGWLHEIRVEDVLTPDAVERCPTLLDGRGRCPPEDCGGVPGYRALIEAKSDPDHPDREWAERWIEGPLDPTDFDRERAERRVAALSDERAPWPRGRLRGRDVEDLPTEALLEAVRSWPGALPVRAMEGIVERGEDAVAPVVAALGEGEPGPEPPTGREGPSGELRLVVLLGLLGDARGTEPLVRRLRRTDDEVLQVTAAEALGRIGRPALPALMDVLEDGDELERLPAYGALGWMREEEAFQRLLEALERDEELTDVVASALADQRREEAVEPLHRALRRCRPWQRPEVEDAIRELARGEVHSTPLEGDWRLRYRPRPEYGGMFEVSPLWIASLARRMSDIREARKPRPVRSLEEIVADDDEADEPRRCDSCGYPVERPTGLPVCPETAVAAATLQARFLERAERDGEEDLFDLLDELTVRERVLTDVVRDAEAPVEPPGGPSSEWVGPVKPPGTDDALERVRIHARTCAWLLERGAEDVTRGRVLLAREKRRLEERFGPIQEPGDSPFAAGGGSEPVQRDEPKVGRNDPCPCGSGKKYKRCCGRPGIRNPGEGA